MTYERLFGLTKDLIEGLICDDPDEALTYFLDTCSMTDEELEMLGVIDAHFTKEEVLQRREELDV